MILTIAKIEGTFKGTPNVRVYDGDSFAIEGRYYRLSHIDTPEKGSPMYDEASNFTDIYMIGGWEIEEVGGLDIYGRTLVVVHKRNSLTLNELLVAKCLAEPFWGLSTDHLKELYRNNCLEVGNRR